MDCGRNSTIRGEGIFRPSLYPTRSLLMRNSPSLTNWFLPLWEEWSFVSSAGGGHGGKSDAKHFASKWLSYSDFKSPSIDECFFESATVASGGISDIDGVLFVKKVDCDAYMNLYFLVDLTSISSRASGFMGFLVDKETSFWLWEHGGGFSGLDAFLFVEVAGEPPGQPYLGFSWDMRAISSRVTLFLGSLDFDLVLVNKETSHWLWERWGVSSWINLNYGGKLLELSWPLFLTIWSSAEGCIKPGIFMFGVPSTW